MAILWDNEKPKVNSQFKPNRNIIWDREEAITPEVMEKPNSIADILKTALGVGIGTGGAYGIKKGVGKIVSGVSEYPYRKTLAIREGLKKSQKTESKAYGKGLKTISKTSTEMVNPASTIEQMESVLRDRGIIDNAGNKLRPPSNPIEAQYLKSRDILMSEFSNTKGGKINIGDIIQEARNIKAKGGKFGTPKSVEASKLSDTLMEGVKTEIKSSEFKAIQKRYGAHRERMKPLEEIFKPYENIYKTGKGEKVLTDIYGQPTGTRKILKQIPEITGQKIKGAKFMSGVKKIQSLPANLLLGRRLLGLLNVAPMAFDAAEFSKDPMAYIGALESGKSPEEVRGLRKRYQEGTMTEAEKIKQGLMI